MRDFTLCESNPNLSPNRTQSRAKRAAERPNGRTGRIQMVGAFASWGKREPVIRPPVDGRNYKEYGHVHILLQGFWGQPCGNGRHWLCVIFQFISQLLACVVLMWITNQVFGVCECVGAGRCWMCFRCSDGPSLFTVFLYARLPIRNPGSARAARNARRPMLCDRSPWGTRSSDSAGARRGYGSLVLVLELDTNC